LFLFLLVFLLAAFGCGTSDQDTILGTPTRIPDSPTDLSCGQRIAVIEPASSFKSWLADHRNVQIDAMTGICWAGHGRTSSLLVVYRPRAEAGK
jgi:hypothetical protein